MEPFTHIGFEHSRINGSSFPATCPIKLIISLGFLVVANIATNSAIFLEVVPIYVKQRNIFPYRPYGVFC
jgi:hypothetical protein